MTTPICLLLLGALAAPQGDSTDLDLGWAATGLPRPPQGEGGEADDEGWSASVDVGLTMLEGNSESTTGNADAKLGWEDDWNRYDFAAHYSGVRQTDPDTGDAETTSRLYIYTGEYNRFLNEEKTFYGYGKASSRQDEPNGLVQRVDAGGGAGTQYKPWEEAALNVEAGASFVSEDKVGVAEEETVVGRFAYDFKTPVDLVGSTWTITAAGEYLRGGEVETYVQDFGLKRKLTGAWSLSILVNVAWDGNPAPGFVSTDRRYVLALGVDF